MQNFKKLKYVIVTGSISKENWEKKELLIVKRTDMGNLYG